MEHVDLTCRECGGASGRLRGDLEIVFDVLESSRQYEHIGAFKK